MLVHYAGVTITDKMLDYTTNISLEVYTQLGLKIKRELPITQKVITFAMIRCNAMFTNSLTMLLRWITHV